MILCLRSDSPDTELYLMNGREVVVKNLWRADRRLAAELLPSIDALLQLANASWSDVTGLAVFRGPGSFTGLRIGCMVMDTLAYGRSLPIVGTSGDDWLQEGIQLIDQGVDHKSVMPLYGAEPRITSPRK